MSVLAGFLQACCWLFVKPISHCWLGFILLPAANSTSTTHTVWNHFMNLFKPQSSSPEQLDFRKTHETFMWGSEAASCIKSHIPLLIPICSGKWKNARKGWMRRKEGRNEWRRERVEGKSVTRLFLVVLVITGGEKPPHCSALLAPIFTSSPFHQKHPSTQIL